MLKGSLYHHIAGKEDLLVALIDEVHAAAMVRLDTARTMEAGVLARLRWFLRDHTAYNCRHLTRIGVYFREFEHLTGERRKRVAADRRAYDRFVRTLIVEGQTNGEVAASIDARLTANAILGTTNWVYQWFDPESDTPETVAEDLTELSERMLVGGDR